MPTSPARTADDIADTIGSLIDRVADSKLTQEVAKRGQETVEMLAGAGSEIGDRATDAWRDAKPMRKDASKRVVRATSDAADWSNKTWRKSLRPMARDLWKRRTVAMGVAGAAVPAGREAIDSAAERLGLREREERHWGTFFLGLLIGAAAGAIIALLLTPKRGSEMRHEIGARADEMATKAREAEWMPMVRNEDEAPTNGRPEASRPESSADRPDATTPKAVPAKPSVQGTAAPRASATGNPSPPTSSADTTTGTGSRRRAQRQSTNPAQSGAESSTSQSPESRPRRNPSTP